MGTVKRGDLLPAFNNFGHLESDRRLVHNHKL